MNGNNGATGLSFDRSDLQFFHREWVKKAIVELASADGLVIYCGAGVTIDRTGLSWGQLVGNLLRAHTLDLGGNSAGPTVEEVEILLDRVPPIQMASILSQISEDRTGSSEKALNALIPRMQTLLYTYNGWQAGVLARNIIKLALGLVEHQKRVVIVTTNYDTYLEMEYDRQVKKPSSQLVVRVVDSDEPIRGADVATDMPRVEIVYLHGRIPYEGRHDGKVVLGERDYHFIHNVVIKELTKLFGVERTSLLIVGASLTDPPLLAALAGTYHRTKRPRYALVSAPSTERTHVGPPWFAKLRNYLIKRGEHFSVHLLVADFHFQIGQFCQEILTAIKLDDGPSSYCARNTQVAYGKRLVAWWNAWLKTDRERGAETSYEALAGCLNGVRRDMLKRGYGDDDGSHPELMKIELWVRKSPADSRLLALWATSTGILHDRAALHQEELSLSSGNASVQALVEGQPQYVPCSDGRWQAFLSVPIRISTGGGDVPVGVVTLATAKTIQDSCIPLGLTREMERIVSRLRKVGERLLSTAQPVAAPALNPAGGPGTGRRGR